MKTKKKIMTRAVSLLTMGFFLVSQVAFANPGAGIEIAVSRELPSFLRIDIPSELATLDGLYEAPPRQDPKLILHIQNAHANYGAQQKIKELLQYLERHYAMKTIFVEGASEDLNPDYLKMFPDRERNLKLAEFLAKQGELTGAELYLMEQDSATEGKQALSTPKAHGIEDAGLYRENYEALKKVFGAEVTVKRYLNGFEGRLSSLASKVFSKDLLKLLGEWKKFEAGHREFMPYVKGLAAESKRVLGIDLESLLSQIEWPQITRLLVLQTMEKELDMQKGLAERDQLIKFLKEKRVSANLITAIENFRDQQVTVLQGTRGGAAAPVEPRDLMEQLVTEAGPKGFYFYNYPHFSLYAGYLILKSEMDPKGLFGEIRVLFTRILDQLAVSQREKKLLELYRSEELVRKLLNLELTRKDWQEVLAKKDLLAMDPLVAELKEIGTAVSQESGLPLSNFETKPVNPKFRGEVVGVQTAAYGFYEAARKREDVFYEKIDSVMRKESLNKAVLITGGFHTDGITELLREHEISYGTLTPRLSEKSNENLYRNVMLQNKPSLFELSYLETTSPLMPLTVQVAQIGKTAMAGRLKSELRAIGAVGQAGSVEDAVQIFNKSEMAVRAEIRIEKTGQNFYKVVSTKIQTQVSAFDIGKILATPFQIRDVVGTMAGTALPTTNPAAVVFAMRLAGQLGQVGETTQNAIKAGEVKAPEAAKAESDVRDLVSVGAANAGVPTAEFAATVAQAMGAFFSTRSATSEVAKPVRSEVRQTRTISFDAKGGVISKIDPWKKEGQDIIDYQRQILAALGIMNPKKDLFHRRTFGDTYHGKVDGQEVAIKMVGGLIGTLDPGKSSENISDEAAVLRITQGMKGIPKLYGEIQTNDRKAVAVVREWFPDLPLDKVANRLSHEELKDVADQIEKMIRDIMGKKPQLLFWDENPSNYIIREVGFENGKRIFEVVGIIDCIFTTDQNRITKEESEAAILALKKAILKLQAAATVPGTEGPAVLPPAAKPEVPTEATEVLGKQRSEMRAGEPPSVLPSTDVPEPGTVALDMGKADVWKMSGSPEAVAVKQKLLGAFHHVTFEEFRFSLRELAGRINEEIEKDGRPYAALWDYKPHSSRRWTYSLLQTLLSRPAAAANYFQGRAEPMTQSLKNMADQGIGTFLIVDDAAYSGEQLNNTIKSVADYYRKWGLLQPKVIVAVPYMTSRVQEMLTGIDGAQVTTISIRPMPSLSEILTPEEINILRQSEGGERFFYTGATATVFDHRIADDHSFAGELVPLLDIRNYRKPYGDAFTGYYQREQREFDAYFAPMSGASARSAEQGPEARSEVRGVAGSEDGGISRIREIIETRMQLHPRPKVEWETVGSKRKPQQAADQISVSTVAWVASRIQEIAERFDLGIDTAAGGLVMNEQGDFGQSEGLAAWVVVPSAVLSSQTLAGIFRDKVRPGGILVVAYPQGEVPTISGSVRGSPEEQAETGIESFSAGKLEDRDIHYVIIRKSSAAFTKAAEGKRSEGREGEQLLARSEARAGEQPSAFPKAADLEVLKRVPEYAWYVNDRTTNEKWYLKVDDPREMEKEVRGYRLAALVGVNTPRWTETSVEDLSMPEKFLRYWSAQIMGLGYDIDQLGFINAILSRDAKELTLPELVESRTSGIERILAFLALTGATDFKLDHNVGMSRIDGRRYYALFDLTNATEIQPIGTPFSFDGPLVLDALSEMSPEFLVQAVRDVASIDPQDLQRFLGGTSEDILSLIRIRQEALGATVRQALSVIKEQNADRLDAGRSARIDALINALAEPRANAGSMIAPKPKNNSLPPPAPKCECE
ncbi:MAG: hypothetical protein V1673_04360 [Candidatus Omnitrophota bacterium]